MGHNTKYITMIRSSILLWDIYQYIYNIYTHIHRNKHIRMLLIVFFKIASNWKQLKCISVEKYIYKLNHINNNIKKFLTGICKQPQ